MACSYKPAHPYPLNDIEFQAELLTDRRGERSYGSRLNVKKLRAAALRERECAIASKRAARIAHRFRPASPSRGNRRSMVSLEEAQRSAAVAVYALDCSSFSTPCLPLFSTDSPGGITGVAVGKSSGNTPRPSGSFSDSTHRRMVSFSSSIAAHPARPKLAETVIETSATRVRARIDLAIVRVAGSLVGVWGGREGGTVWLPRG